MLVGLVAPHRRAFAGLGLLMALSAALPIAASFAMARFVDRVIAQAPVSELVTVALTFAGLGLASSLLIVVVTWRSALLAWRLTNGLRHELASLVLNADLSFHRDRTPGELLTRCDGDVTALTSFLSAVVARIAGISMLAIASLVVMALVEPWLAVPMAVGFAALAWRGWSTRDTTTAAVTRERTIDSEMNSIIEQYVSGAEDVASLGAGAHGLRRFGDAARRLVDAMSLRTRAEMKVNSGLRAVILLTQIAVLGAGLLLFRRGGLGIGDVVLGYRLVDVVRSPVEHLTWRLMEAQGVSGAAQRVTELLEEGRRVDLGERPLPAGPLALEFSNAGLVYDDASQGEAALQHLNLRVEAGRVVGLLGRSGSGKTSAIRLALRLVNTTSGSVTLGGVDVGRVLEADFRRRVSAIPQDVQLFPGTVRENVTMFDSDLFDSDLFDRESQHTDERIVDALVSAGLGPWLADLPSGLDTMLSPDNRAEQDDRAGLSAGEAQLLAIARALLHHPDVVVLDEATARVDPVTQAAISVAVARLLDGRTGVIIAHRLETLSICDDIAVLADGELVEFGARVDLLTDPGSRYAQLLAMGAEAEELA
ncbi:MAG: ABC transporter ATP-binding protein [Actinomycetota bacterium]|nr:ABC transporter ATP-binding protein [Actinomycetota bacterium]